MSILSPYIMVCMVPFICWIMLENLKHLKKMCMCVFVELSSCQYQLPHFQKYYRGHDLSAFSILAAILQKSQRNSGNEEQQKASVFSQQLASIYQRKHMKSNPDLCDSTGICQTCQRRRNNLYFYSII